jgi:hypothetical protein
VPDRRKQGLDGGDAAIDMTATSCLNCDTPLAAAQRFCGSCGQKTAPARLTMGQMTHDFVHALTHVDHSIFSLVKDLAWRPGLVAREYVGGRRKKYFGPLAFLMIAVGLASFMIVIADVKWFSPITATGPAGFLQRHINLVILIQMPILAGGCALLFRTHRLHYAEHLVLAAYSSGFRILVLGLVATPIMYFLHLNPADRTIVPAYYGLWLVYFSVAAVQFYRGGRFWIVVRAVIAAILGQAVTMLLILGFVLLYGHLKGYQ